MTAFLRAQFHRGVPPAVLLLALLLIAGVCSPGVALATIFWMSSSSGANNGLPTDMTAGALIIAKPVGTVAGQALIATVAARPHGMTVTVPANWYAMTVTEQTAGGPSTLPGGMTLLTYYHIVDLAEPASYTWTFANKAGSGASYGGSAVGGLLAFSGIDTSGGNPINVWSALPNANAQATGITTTSITPTVTATMIVSSLSYLSGDSFNPPTLNGVAGVLTKQLDQRAPAAVNAVGTTLQMSTASRATATATGAARAIAVSNDDTGVGHLMALTPAAIDLAITMTRSAPLNPGGSASYTLKVINNGINSEPGPISVVDTLPTGLTYNAAGSGGTGWVCGAVGQVVTCTRGALAADAPAADLVINVNVSAGATGTLTNTATVSGTGGDKNMYNNTATDSYTFTVDLKLIMISGALNPGQNGTFTLDVSNIGGATDPGPITITDTLPVGLTYVSGVGTNWTCGGGPPVTCTRSGTLGNGAAAGTLTLTVAVAQTGFAFTNTATVSGTGDSDLTNNSATVTYNVSADLALTMTRGAALVPGTNATYTLSVTNNGPNVAPQPITITDTLPAGLTYVSGTGTGWTCGGVTCTLTGTLANGASSSLVLTVAVAAGASGTINNTATVTGTATDSDATNNSATDSFTIVLPTYAYYKMDEASWNGTAGEVKDSSGNGRNASKTGAGVTTQAAPASGSKGDTCMGAIIPSAGSGTQMGVDTPINPNASGLGNAGTVSFWYKNNVAWTANGNTNDRTLLDATGSSSSREFWLVLRQNGSLQFSLDNASGNAQTATGAAHATSAGFGSNTWHHIAITWNFTTQKMFIYVDGVQDGTRSSTNVTSETPKYGTFFVGDSKTGFITAPNRGNSANGVIDEVRFYASALTAAQITTDMNAVHSCSTFDHLRIRHDGEGSTCAAESITVEACADPLCTSLVTTGGITATLQPFGTAVSIGTSGWQTLSVTPSIPGANTLGAASIVPTPANATSCLNTVTSSASCTMYVSACPGGSNFNCLETSITPYPAILGDARLYTKLAGTAFSFDVVALNSSSAVETNYVVSDATPKNVTVELFDDSTSPQPACSAYASPLANQTLSFVSTTGRNTTASFTVPNAYRKLRCRVTDANMAPTAYGCSSDDFSVRPGAVTLFTSPVMATPPSASSPAPIKAGASFTLRAATTASANYSGTLALDTLDSSKLTAQTTSQDTTQQIGGVPGTLTPSSLTANATAVNATYSEVGYLYLAQGAYRDDTFTAVDSATGDCITSTVSDANLADTLSGGKYGCSIGNKTIVSFGRFIPDHFDTVVTAPMACTGLTFTSVCPSNNLAYSGQPFSVQVTANNAGGTPTQNYQGAFAKAVTLSAVTASGGATAAPGGTLSPNSAAASSFAGGSNAATLAKPVFTFATTPTAPTDVYVRAMDTDNVSSLRATANSSVEGGVKVASGRIRIPNMYGSEKLKLPMTATVQYYDGLNWVTSLTDSVTSLTAVGAIIQADVGSLPHCALSSISVSPVVAGIGSITLPPPGVACSANLSANGGSYLPSSIARATFGIYKSPLIYRRENY